MKKRGWTLVHNGTLFPVAKDDTFNLRDGAVIITGGAPPHKPGSTGRVYVKYIDDEETWESEYFPGVCNCQWVRDET